MTDQEINEAVHEKLHGKPYDPFNIPDYCTSIQAAWEIVEKEAGFDLFFARDYQGEKWSCTFTVKEGDRPSWVVGAKADTAPMAICLAFLKLS